MSRWAKAALVAGVLLARAAPAEPAPQAPGAAEQLIAMSGGVYRDAGLARYLRSVGVRLVAAAGQPAARWSFTVLDTPETNAFALPGRRIFVTRGMLALVGDEAELATVLGHEIGHSLAGDGTTPESDRARRAAEVAADRTGLRLLTGAGYDPGAQADFLTTLLASRALEARLRGGDADPGGAPDHPALADRLNAARREAGAAAGAGVRNRAAYLAAIDGMTWGDGPAQGFVRGRSFVHPELGFAFDAPPGYAVANLPDAVVASGPDGAMLLMDSVADPGGSPADYLARGWVPEIARGIRAGRLQALRRGKLNGLAMGQGAARDGLGRQRAGRGADGGAARGPPLPAHRAAPARRRRRAGGAGGGGAELPAAFQRRGGPPPAAPAPHPPPRPRRGRGGAGRGDAGRTAGAGAVRRDERPRRRRDAAGRGPGEGRGGIEANADHAREIIPIG